MKLLLYCILWARSDRHLPADKGVQDREIKFIEHEQIAAVVSDFDPSVRSLDVQNLILYHDVIDSCFQMGAVIPFRFKTILANEAEIKRLLVQRGTDYESNLSRLKDKTEMGIRLILDKIQTEKAALNEPLDNEMDSESPGMSYLAKRKNVYSYQNAVDTRCQELVDISKKALEGLYVDFKLDASQTASSHSSGKEIMISSYFLIDKSSVQQFKAIFEEIKPGLGARVLVSGPWAPYNFV